MKSVYKNIYFAVSRGDILPMDMALRILDVDDLDTFSLVQLAYRFRQKYYRNVVSLHVINNVQNGHCSEDCHYCAQSKFSTAEIKKYPMKSDEEILREAEAAYRSGADHYALVFSGKGPTDECIDHLMELIRTIKGRWPIKICVSPGMITAEQAQKLKSAGLDWFHHNLNTSQTFYPKICTTHTYQDRLRALEAARSVGLSVCSGVIIGMGETQPDVVSMAVKLREIGVASIPVNFLIPIPGTPLTEVKGLSPEYCLRVLCLFRLMNPKAEIRIGAGWEIYFQSLEHFGLYPANSVFLNGYLNVSGSSYSQTMQMINDKGFSISSGIKVDDFSDLDKQGDVPAHLKDELELRPYHDRIFK